VLFTAESQCQLYQSDGRQCVLRHVKVRFAVNIVNRVPHFGGGVMVWAGINYRQRTQLNFIDGGLIALRSWCPLLCHSSAAITSCFNMIIHGPMSQGSVHNSWKLQMSQFFHSLHTHHTCNQLSMFGMLFIYVYNTVFQFPPISCNFAQPFKRIGTTFHRPQSTA
jgi:hypothetical protein